MFYNMGLEQLPQHRPRTSSLRGLWIHPTTSARLTTSASNTSVNIDAGHSSPHGPVASRLVIWDPTMSCNVGIEHVPQHRPGLCPTPWVPSTSLSIRPSHVSQHRSWTRPTTSVPNISYPKGPEYIPDHVTGKHLKSGALHTVVNMHSRHGQHLYVLHHGRRIRPTT